MGGVISSIGGTLGGIGGSVGGMFETGMDFIGDPLGKKAIQGGVDAQGRAMGSANRHLQKGYEEYNKHQQPWEQAGLSALTQMQDSDFKRDFTAADFQKDPGFDFRMQEGQKALERSAAARGGLMSGGTLKGIARYGQDFASNEYGNAYNRFNADRDRRYGRLSQLAGMGQNASNNRSNNAMAYRMGLGNNIMGFGNAQAGAAMANANANQGLLGGLMSMMGAKGGLAGDASAAQTPQPGQVGFMGPVHPSQQQGWR